MACFNPNEVMDYWCVCDSNPMSNYYTKKEVDDIVEGIEVSGVTEEQVQQMIDTNLSPIAEQVSANTLSILNTYNKSEINELFNGFVKIENKTLIINE